MVFVKSCGQISGPDHVERPIVAGVFANPEPVDLWHYGRMVNHRKSRRRLTDAYAVPGFRPLATVRGVFGDRHVRVVTLVRRSKKRRAASAAQLSALATTAKPVEFAICRAAIHVCFWNWRSGASIIGTVAG